jgi:hypothetical protein
MAALEICSRRIPSSLPRQMRGPAGPEDADAPFDAGDDAGKVLDGALAGASLAGDSPSQRLMKAMIIGAGEGCDPAARERLVAETADLWFHCLVMLAQYGLRPEQVLAELQRRAGVSGIEEKAARKAEQRERGERGPS